MRGLLLPLPLATWMSFQGRQWLLVDQPRTAGSSEDRATARRTMASPRRSDGGAFLQREFVGTAGGTGPRVPGKWVFGPGSVANPALP